MNSAEKENQDLKFDALMLIIKSNQEAQSIHNAHAKEMLERIELQTIKTNGRVTCLEGWRWKVIGISIGAIFVIGYIIQLI